MSDKHRFLISYICDNQPNTLEISCREETLSVEEAEDYIKSANPATASPVTDIQVVGLHRQRHPNVHPGHYQQPEG